MPNKKVKLIPPDKKQCQADKPNPNHSFMSFGIHPKYIRCENKPTVILYATVVTNADGQKGSMSLCNDCLKVFLKQVGIDGHKVESFNKPKAKKKA